MDKGETVLDTLRREIREEVGCEIEVGDEVGAIIEYRNQLDILQISYCFLAKVKGEVGKPAWEEDEIEEGLSLFGYR